MLFATVVAAVTGAAVLAPLLIPLLAESFQLKSSIAAENVDTRFLRWDMALRMMAANPVLGVGPGGFRSSYMSVSTNAELAEQTPVAHEMYLEVGAEFGVLGLVLFVGLIVVALRASERALSFGAERSVVVLLQASMVAVLSASVSSPSSTTCPCGPGWRSPAAWSCGRGGSAVTAGTTVTTRVLHIINEMGVGGAEALVQALVEGGASVGWRSAVVSSGGWRADALAAADQETHLVRRIRRDPRSVALAMIDTRSAIRNARPDVVVAHNILATVVARGALCSPGRSDRSSLSSTEYPTATTSERPASSIENRRPSSW